MLPLASLLVEPPLRVALYHFFCYMVVQTIASPLGALSLSRSGCTIFLFACPLLSASGVPSQSEWVFFVFFILNKGAIVYPHTFESCHHAQRFYGLRWCLNLQCYH